MGEIAIYDANIMQIWTNSCVKNIAFINDLAGTRGSIRSMNNCFFFGKPLVLVVD